METTDGQVRKLMEELSKHGEIGKAAMKAGMDRKTARKYKKLGRMPSEEKQDRPWRTREDPFSADWPDIHGRLKDAPELEALALFEHLLEEKPGVYSDGQLRTFQRRVKEWRATEGPPKEVFFQQQHRPGEAMQTDFTWATELGITICGEPFDHMLCHPVLPYSNWEWATVCRSESINAIKRGVQAALFRLGRVPEYSQTDNSTAATHELKAGDRGFNQDYVAIMNHFGMKPRTIQVGKKNQNGDNESLHNALKRRLRQHLLLRGSSDFPSVEAYEDWLWGTLEKANRLREPKLSEELKVMRPLRVDRLPEYTVEDVKVNTGSTIRVKNNTYSVPSRLVGERVRVRIYDRHLEVYYGGRKQLTMERLLGRGKHRINYRHVIWSLVRKPGAFLRYTWRDDLFPTLTFRKAYDELCEKLSSRQADRNYLRILHLAASTVESDVEAALELLLESGDVPGFDQVKALVVTGTVDVPEMKAFQVELQVYDDLLERGEGVG